MFKLNLIRHFQTYLLSIFIVPKFLQFLNSNKSTMLLLCYLNCFSIYFFLVSKIRPLFDCLFLTTFSIYFTMLSPFYWTKMGGTLWWYKNINPQQIFLEKDQISCKGLQSKKKPAMEWVNGMGCKVFPLLGRPLGINWDRGSSSKSFGIVQLQNIKMFIEDMSIHCDCTIFFVVNDKALMMMNITFYIILLLDIMIENIMHLLRFWRIIHGKRIIEFIKDPCICNFVPKKSNFFYSS